MEAPILSPEDFLAGVSDVVDWVHAIQSREVRVVFFSLRWPESFWISSLLTTTESNIGMCSRSCRESMLSRAWIYPSLREVELPDLSHAGPSDRATMTRALEDELLRMGLMDHSGRLIQESALELQGQGVAPDQPFHLPKPVREGDVAPGRIQ